MQTSRAQQGFTLVEMIVSLGLFTIIMFIATSAFLTIVNTDRKARGTRIAMDNLTIALEDISRRIKTGSSYYCGPGGEGLSAVNDCGGTSDTFFFTNQEGVRIKYYLDTVNKIIYRDTTPVTSSEIKVNALRFLVSGSAVSPNTEQPKVVIAIDGTFGIGPMASNFKIQTTVTQRAYDN